MKVYGKAMSELNESSWTIPTDEALYLPFSVEITVESFINLHEMIGSLLELCLKHAKRGSFEESGVEDLLVGSLCLLRKCTRFLVAGVDCNTLKETTTLKGEKEIPILESIRDILHRIFTGSWLIGIVSACPNAQKQQVLCLQMDWIFGLQILGSR